MGKLGDQALLPQPTEMRSLMHRFVKALGRVLINKEIQSRQALSIDINVRESLSSAGNTPKLSRKHHRRCNVQGRASSRGTPCHLEARTSLYQRP